MASATKNVQLDNLKCRICLFPKQNLCPLFRRGLSMKVMKLAEIKMYEGDGLPSSICLDCELEVLRCTNFITRIQKADAKLKEMLVREKELCAAQEIKMKFKKLSERLPEKEDKYQEPSTSKGDILYDNNYHPEDENEQPLIEIEEFNVKQEIASFDQFLTEKEEVHSDGDQDHYGDDEHDNGQPEDEIELNPINHVDIVEDRHKGDEMEVSNDPLGQEEPLIETQKNESDPSVDPLTCMKQEVVPMDIDKDNSEAPGSSSSVKRTHTTISFSVCTETPNKFKRRKIKTEPPDGRTRNTACLNINAVKSTGNEDKCQLQETFTNKMLINSIISDESEDKETFCRICDVEYGSLELLNKHKERNSFICRVCGVEFNRHAELETHFQIHLNFNCGKCKESVLTRKDLVLHWREKHLSEIFKCNLCNKTYTRSRNLRKHELLEHSSINISLECVVCGKMFNAWNLLDAHLRKIHLAYENIECKSCNRTFLGPYRIKDHMRMVHSYNAPVRCETCGKVYKTAYILRKHQKTHDKSEKLCRICGQSFQGEISMNHHMKHEHLSRGVFKCKYCSDTFIDEALLTAHRRKNHLKQKSHLPRTECCEICGKMFKSTQILKVHKRIHFNEKCFTCHICGASFIQNAALRTHQRIHSSVGKYICDYCNKSFKWKQTLIRHVQKCNMKEKGGQNQ